MTTTSCPPAGTGDDTCWIQGLLDSQAVVRLPAGTFHITQLELNSGQRLIMGTGTVLRPIASPVQDNRLMLWANGVDDVVIEGGVIDGTGAIRSIGIALTGVNRARVMGTHSINMVEIGGMRGDGFYINKSLGGDRRGRIPGRRCEDVVLEDVTAEGNGRQGVMVASVSGLRLRNASLLNTTGSHTGAGIDIEPNRPTDTIEDIDIDRCVITGNHYGMLFQPSGSEEALAVTLRNSTVSNNRTRGVSVTKPDTGVSARCAVLIKGNAIKANGAQGINASHIQGGVRVENNLIQANGGHGVLLDFCNRWTVSGNQLVGNGERGVAVTTRDTSVGEFGQIIENQIWDNGQSPALPAGGPGVVISSSTIEPEVLIKANTFGTTTGRQTSAVQTSGPCSTVKITGNQTIGIQEAVHLP